MTNRVATSQGMGTLNLMRYAWSELWNRRWTAQLTTAAVAVSAIYIYVLGFDGSAIHEAQRRCVDRSAATEIVASVPDVANRELRFTKPQVDTCAALSGVALAFPRIELNVVLAIGESQMATPIEGTVPGDPRLAKERLIWGRAPRESDTVEIVLDLRVFEKLGGVYTDAPYPERLVLEVSRTVAGRPETQRLTTSIVGLYRGDRADKTYISLEMAEKLDLWCTAKLRSLAPNPESTAMNVTYAWVDGYVPFREEARLAEELKHLEASAERVGEVNVIKSAGPIWAALTRADGQIVREADRRAALEALNRQIESVSLTQWGAKSVAVLTNTDPRWSENGGSVSSDIDRAWIARADGRAVVYPNVTVEPGGRDWPVGADLVCTTATALWACFDPATCSAAEPVTVVETNDIWAGFVLADVCPPERFVVDQSACYLFLRAPADSPTYLEFGGVVDTRITYFEGLLPCGEPDADVDREESMLIRFLPDEAFEQLTSNRKPMAGDLPSVLLNRPIGESATPSPLESPVGRFYVMTTVERDFEWIAAPESERLRLCPDARPVGYVQVGDWTEVASSVASYLRNGWMLDVGSTTPCWFSAFLPCSIERIPQELRSRCAIHQVRGLTAREIREAKEPRLLVGPDALDFAGMHADTVCTGEKSLAGQPLTFQTAHWSIPPLNRAYDRRVPSGVAVVAEPILRRALFEACGDAMVRDTEQRYDVVFEDGPSFAAAQARLAKLGLKLTSLSAITEERLIHYRVREGSGVDGVRDDFVAVLAMSRPTFVMARGHLAVQAQLGQTSIEVIASDAQDPARFYADLVSGAWLSGGTGREIVLPRNAVGEYTPGCRFSLRFERQTETDQQEGLELTFTVTGVSDEGPAYIPAKTAAKIQLWRDRKLVFNDARGTFASPLEIKRQAGHIRCNLFAMTAEAVPQVLRDLCAMGYNTEDRLAEQEGLQRLARILAFMAMFFVFGVVLNAVITVVITTIMHVKNKTFEIGILLAHGVKPRDAWNVFVLEGFAIGLIAFLIASLAVWVGEPYLRQLTAQGFGIDADMMLAGSPFDSTRWWLPVLVLGVSVLFSVFGVALPAWFACRLRPVVALRTRGE